MKLINFTFLMSPKIKEFNFIVKTGPKAELYNGTFTPINAIELSFDDKKLEVILLFQERKNLLQIEYMEISI